ncbi:MAG: adenine nucleotide alpha hydrolase family protein [Firmicutes bacterium]|nr:adenine nucleotide alpha hydrolase family protein [Bacillota bacterium]
MPRTQRWIFSRVRQAVKDFSLIEPGDRIVVGLSGGKDSLGLLYILSRLRNFHGFDFELKAVHLDLGWSVIGLPPADVVQLGRTCAELEVPFENEPTQIAEIVFAARREDHPCALCAHLRRGALNNVAKRLGFNKVALGHHRDDAIETFFLNLFYNGQMNTFTPRTDLTRSGLILIRPLVYLPERALAQLVAEENLAVVKNSCPASGQTKRQEVKQVVSRLVSQYPELGNRAITAFKNVHPDLIYGWAPKKVR